MPISNSEKQARFRKKEELKKFAEKTFREWQVMTVIKRESPQEVMNLLAKAAELPPGWSDDDLARAEHRVGQLRLDLVTSNYNLQNDVHAASYSQDEFMRTPDPGKFIHDSKMSVSKAYGVASHLISALQLTELDAAEQAAAVMEVVRYVGRALASSSDIPHSNATTVCLASMPGFYDRPEWFLDALAKWLTEQLDEKHAQALGKLLVDYDYEART